MAKFKRGSLALARQVFNTPQLVLAEDLQSIAQFLVNRANGIDALDTNIDKTAKVDTISVDLSSLTEQERKERRWRQLGITNDGKRGHLEVTGTLVAKAGEIDADCMELTSYEKLYNTFTQQINEGIQELVLHVDSGGGQAFSCFEMAAEVKSLANKRGVKIYTFIDGLAASAAYAWASIGDEVIARKGSEVGSIGVVVQLVNNAKMLENIGITRQFITHGESKVPFGDDGEFTPQFISSIQKKVNKTGLEFNTLVATNRNMQVEDVIATQAEVFDAEAALSLGLIDKIMTRSEFFDNYLPNQQSNQTNVYFMKTEDNMTQNMQVGSDELQAQLTDLTAQLDTKTSAYDGLVTELAELNKTVATLTATNEKLALDLEANQKAQITSGRKMKLEAALGKDNEKIESLLSSTEKLEDSAFEVILGSLSSSITEKAEAAEELGDEGQQAEVQVDLAQQIASRLNAQ